MTNFEHLFENALTTLEKGGTMEDFTNDDFNIDLYKEQPDYDLSDIWRIACYVNDSYTYEGWR